MSDDYLAPEFVETVEHLGDLSIVTAAAFASVDEPGIESLLGTPDDNLIPVGSDVMLYGDGGAGKTTLTLDLACHLVTRTPWLGIPVPDRRRVLLVENEGPRPLFRKKLRRKLEAWPWPNDEPGERLHIWEAPWSTFSFAEAEARAQLARLIFELEIDLVIAGPLTQLGMDDAGTLQDVRRFAGLIAQVRERSLRPVAFLLIHHESKAGRVSGAWEGVGDTLLQLQSTGHRSARLFVQKSRWSATWHAKTIRLAWGVGDSFEVEDTTPAEQRLEEVYDAIIEYVTTHGGCGWTEIEDSLGVNATAARKRREYMLTEGVIVDLGEGDRKARGHRYRLWLADDPARPLSLDELAGEPQKSSQESSDGWTTPHNRESSEVRTDAETTLPDTRDSGIREESSGRPPSKADDSSWTNPAANSSGADEEDPDAW